MDEMLEESVRLIVRKADEGDRGSAVRMARALYAVAFLDLSDASRGEREKHLGRLEVYGRLCEEFAWGNI